MLNACLWFFFDKNPTPKVFDKRIREEFVANSDVIVSKSVSEKNSIFSVIFFDEIKAMRAGEDDAHSFYNVSFIQ